MCSPVVARLAALEVEPVGVLVGAGWSRAAGSGCRWAGRRRPTRGPPRRRRPPAAPPPCRPRRRGRPPAGRRSGRRGNGSSARTPSGGTTLPGDVEALPPEPLEDRRQHGHQVVREQDVEEHVDPAEVVGVQLAQPAVGQVLEADVEPFVEGAVARPDRAHVRLHRHQQHGVEALGLPVARVDLDLLGGGPPRQRPRRVGHHQRRRAVGVDQLASRRRHPPEAVLVGTSWSAGRAGEAGDRAFTTGEPGVVDRRLRHPVPVAGVRRREAHAPPVLAVPEGRPPQHVVAAGEVGPHLDVGVGRRGTTPRRSARSAPRARAGVSQASHQLGHRTPRRGTG